MKIETKVNICLGICILLLILLANSVVISYQKNAKIKKTVGDGQIIICKDTTNCLEALK